MDDVTPRDLAAPTVSIPLTGATPNQTSRVFFPEIESLRGLAAVTVVIFHVFGTVEPSPKVFSHYGAIQGGFNFLLTGVFNGTAAVTLFFVISGFVLSCNTDPKRGISLAGYIQFGVRRLFRILPAMWASIVVTVILNRLYYHIGYSTDDLVRFVLLRDTSINGTFWSLKVELFASFIFPFLLFFSRSLGVVFNVILLGGLLEVALSDSPFAFIYFYCFLLGIFTPIVGPLLFRRLPPFVQNILFVVALLAFAVPVQLSRLGYMNSRQHVVFEAFSSLYLVCYVLYGHSDWLRNLLTTTPARWLGRISYSLYVIHYTIVTLATNLALRLLGKAFFDSYPILFQVFTLPVVVLVSLVVADVSFRLAERPFHVYGRSVATWLSDSVRSIGLQLDPAFRLNGEMKGHMLLGADWGRCVAAAIPLAIAVLLSIDIFWSAWEM